MKNATPRTRGTIVLTARMVAILLLVRWTIDDDTWRDGTTSGLIDLILLGWLAVFTFLVPITEPARTDQESS